MQSAPSFNIISLESLSDMLEIYEKYKINRIWHWEQQTTERDNDNDENIFYLVIESRIPPR